MNVSENRDATVETINRILLRRRRAAMICDALEHYEEGNVAMARSLMARAASLSIGAQDGTRK